MSNGWIKMHRALLEWEHFKEGSVLKVFLALLLSADRDGQTSIKLDELMTLTGLGSCTIKRALSKLVASGEISRQKYGARITTTIANWSQYQMVSKVSQRQDLLVSKVSQQEEPLVSKVSQYRDKNDTNEGIKSIPIQYNKKDNKNEQEEIVVANAHTREVFVANALTDLAVEKGCMAMRITPERYRQLVTEVITDWEFTQLPEREWTLTHLLSQMRIKNSINNRNNGQQNQQSTERGNGAVHTVSGFKILNRQ
jgi:hypothetical protein